MKEIGRYIFLLCIINVLKSENILCYYSRSDFFLTVVIFIDAVNFTHKLYFNVTHLIVCINGNTSFCDKKHEFFLHFYIKHLIIFGIIASTKHV